MRQRLYKFMQGRYGVDAFGYFLMWTTTIIIFLNLFFRNYYINVLGMFMIIYTYFRMLSRNISKRMAENRWYLTHTQGIRNWFVNMKKRMMMRKTHRIFTCPSCKQKVKVPKGKGKIEVSCPKCREKFVRRS